MADSERRTEAELEAAFAAARPGILGGLLTVISEALRVLPTVTLDRPPRMADFATWATAAEAALGWKPGTFAAVYDKQRAAAREVVLEGSTITAPLRTLLDEQATWTGTATELLK